MIPISRPIIGDEEKQAVLEVLGSGQLVQGPRVKKFEEQFAEWCGVKYAVATSSGTSALHVALVAHEIADGDEVITTSFSFIASANCALYVGAKPVFADIEPDYFTLDPEDAARKITPRTRAIVPVHLYGQPCDMGRFEELAQKHKLLLIEDACQAHGATLHGRKVGTWGTACYSFYATKNMTTIEGGMLTTDDPHIAERARLIRDHGSPARYRHEIVGYNLRMTDLQAALGLAQLPHLDEWNARRQANAAFLTGRLSRNPHLVTPPVRPQAAHVFHQYTVRVPDRESAQAKLSAAGVGSGVYYPLPIHQQEVYLQRGYRDSLPHTEAACREVLSLPVYPALTAAELETIAATAETL